LIFEQLAVYWFPNYRSKTRVVKNSCMQH